MAMHLSRLVVAAAVCSAVIDPGAAPLRAQSPTRAPSLSRPQRTTLEALVAATDAALAGGPTADATWTSHVLRTSDGAHYVALSARLADPAPAQPAGVYVRLATRRPPAVTVVSNERSAVMEWLRGQRSDPLPRPPARSTTVNPGEMPVGGTAAAVGDVAAGSSAALRLMALQQEREERLREERDARRRAELERAGAGPSTGMFPFEDFDLSGRSFATADGRLEVRRGVTAGPGDYDLLIAIALTGSGSPAPTVVTRTTVTLPAAEPSFGLSDVIVASAVEPRNEPYPSSEQSAHPYAIGTLEVTPAPGNVLQADRTLGLVYQVINPAGSARGKPDVEVSFQVNRIVGARVETFGQLQPQRHDEQSVPADFHVAAGHPLFGAIRAPLASFPRGRYQVAITATDRLAGRRAASTVDFEVKGSALSLLREAPALGRPFRREAILTPPLRAALVAALRPEMPSAALEAAMAAAGDARYADLLRDAPVEPLERAVAAVFRALGLYALGDSPRTVAVHLQQAIGHGAPPAAPLVVLGATSALSGDHKAAVTQWHQARDAGLADALLAPLLIDAYLRLGDTARAEAMAQAALDASPSDQATRHLLAATHVASGRYADAVALLATVSDTAADESAFLRLHALYALLVNARPGDDATTTRARFAALARPYVEAAGPNHALVAEWLAVADPATGR